MEKIGKKLDDYTSVTARLDAMMIKEIDGIAEALFSNRTAILQECLRLGLEAFKKKRPEMMKIVKANQRRSKK